MITYLFFFRLIESMENDSPTSKTHGSPEDERTRFTSAMEIDPSEILPPGWCE